MSLPDPVALDDLGGWLAQQRWFGSKARGVAEVGELERVALSDDPPLAVSLVEARFGPGTHELYQLLPGAPEALGALGRLLRESATVGDVAFRLVDGEEGPSGHVREMGAEQSNSSVVFGDRLVLKVFRRLEPGDNPELEMLRFLRAKGFDEVAALAGWYEFAGETLDATLGVLQRFVPEARDGWELALDDPAGMLARAGELGAATGRMHSVLGSEGGDPAFAPEEPSMEALSLLTATIDEQIERVFVDLDPDAESLAPIAHRGEEIREQLRLRSHVGIGGRLIRNHGDFHLGQTLLADAGWVILDFEGEPARPLLERRRKRSPLRDVAGMLRSFAYAASASELLRGVPSPDGWEEAARAAFLDGYLDAVEPVLLPAGRPAIEKLLAIFELEKAVYELRYEINNRPDWVRIPVAGIARLLEGSA